MPRHTEWSDALIAELSRPFPTAWVKQKTAGGRRISFVSWHLYVQRLNDLVGPGWSMGDPILKEVGGKLIMGLPVTILGVTRINFGSEEEEHGNADEDGKVRDFGSAETNAFAQALKRTLALFGMGLSLYDKDGLMQWRPAPETSNLHPEHAASLDFIRANGERCSAEVQAHIKAGWRRAQADSSTAATLADLVEESSGATFSPPR